VRTLTWQLVSTLQPSSVKCQCGQTSQENNGVARLYRPPWRPSSQGWLQARSTLMAARLSCFFNLFFFICAWPYGGNIRS